VECKGDYFPILLFLLPYHINSRYMQRDIAMADRTPNRLISEKSPYLLQHAYNPVDWYPWGEEAFEKARQENKPIFLSIGYSTCHWCHVMEKESFEDEEVARRLNQAFVCIKVDREERPDIDQIYMTVCQIMTGSGGWPLTIIMTPDRRPFFAATYLPKSSRFGRVGLVELIAKIQLLWETRRKEVLASADKIVTALATVEQSPESAQISDNALKTAYEGLSRLYDASYGGFGKSPKFPTTHQVSFLLRYWHRTGEAHALEMVENTLVHMRMGGVYDHIGYGFHRYSTDRQWLVPHFEKMLYDQALIAIAYLEGFQVTGNEEYANTAKEIFEYVLRDMRSPMGGFYCAEDADSEGVEGKFYLWTKKEVLDVLGHSLGELFCRVYNIKEEGNYREEATGRPNGTNIVYLTKGLDLIARELKMAEVDLKRQMELSRQKLLDQREKRIRPQRDDKILTDWNGLMLASLAIGARALQNAQYLEAAKRGADFVLRYLKTRKGRLLHRYRDGEAAVEAHLDDYAFLVWGLIELYEVSFDAIYLNEALSLTEIMLQRYWDPLKGGFFFTSDDGEQLIVRRKEIYDGALPSGNSIALANLLRLSHLTGRADLEQKASELITAFSGQVAQSPMAYTQFLCGVDFALGPTKELLIIGEEQAMDTKDMIRAASGFHPRMVIIVRPSGRGRTAIDSVAEFSKRYEAIGGKATAYLCEGLACQRPITEPHELSKMLADMRLL